jgi:transposase
MGKRKRRRFTPQQKAQAVELVRNSGKSVAEVARDLDLTPSALANWVKQAGIDMKKDPTGALTTDERKELAQLRRDKKRLEQENAFLKKASAFFAKESL